MFVNIDQVPAGCSLFTIMVTSDPKDCAPDERTYDEIDVICPSTNEMVAVIEAASELSDYPDCRIIGAVNQTSGYVIASVWEGMLRWENARGAE